MKKHNLTVAKALTTVIISVTSVHADGKEPVVPEGKRFPFYQNKPLSYLSVTMEDDFWAPRQESVKNVTLDWATEHYDKAGGLKKFRNDPNSYKAAGIMNTLSIMFLEALGFAAGLERDPAVEGLINAWGKQMMKDQAEDGYVPRGRDRNKRWVNRWATHETFRIGHYLESAITIMESTGDRTLYESALRAVERMAQDVMDAQRVYAPGHQEIEQALTRLYGITGQKRYLDLARYVIEQRGHHKDRPSYKKYSQDHLPVKDQRTIEGHAVRAAYLFNGVTEYIGATGDEAYREAIFAIWKDFVEHNMYLHGAGGVKSAGNEGYHEKTYFIPPDDCYGESCSVYGNFRWAHNLFRLTGDASYIDVAERMVYNAFYASLSLRGDLFFYENTIQADDALSRNDWHSCPCCPPNIAKLFCSIGGYFYSTDDRGIYVKHYGASRANIPFSQGIELVQRTDYPWSGSISIHVNPKSGKEHFALRLRLPEWAVSYNVQLNGQTINPKTAKGWLIVDRQWKQGDTIDLDLKMTVKRVYMPEEFEEYNGLVAFQRGPIVYCLESKDINVPIYSVYAPETAKLTAEHRKGFLGGVTVLKGDLRQSSGQAIPAVFIPYGVWCNRGASRMRMWLPEQKTQPPE